MLFPNSMNIADNVFSSMRIQSSTTEWSYRNVFRASKLCAYLQIKARPILSTPMIMEDESPRTLSTEKWFVFYQIALQTRNTQLEADLHIRLTPNYKDSSTLQHEISTLYYKFAKLTAKNGYCASTYNFLGHDLKWSVEEPYRVAITSHYDIQLKR
jgi:hypothetical protein